MAKIKGNGNPLSHQDMDANFTEINTINERVTALEASGVGGAGPAGPQGPQGPQGPKGDKGDPGDSVSGYTLLDVFDNVYKNIPNHTSDLSHGRIRVLEYVRLGAHTIGIPDSKWDQMCNWMRNDDTTSLNNYLNSLPIEMQVQALQLLIALVNYRVHAFNKIYNRSYPTMNLSNFNSWNPGSQYNNDVTNFNSMLNNLSLSDNLIYSKLQNESLTPFEWNTKVTGWNPT